MCECVCDNFSRSFNDDVADDDDDDDDDDD